DEAGQCRLEHEGLRDDDVRPARAETVVGREGRGHQAEGRQAFGQAERDACAATPVGTDGRLPVGERAEVLPEEEAAVASAADDVLFFLAVVSLLDQVGPAFARRDAEWAGAVEGVERV